jgi:hypothetical protein
MSGPDSSISCGHAQHDPQSRRHLKIDETIVPKLRAEESAIRDRLRQALRALSASWEDGESR